MKLVLGLSYLFYFILWSYITLTISEKVDRRPDMKGKTAPITVPICGGLSVFAIFLITTSTQATLESWRFVYWSFLAILSVVLLHFWYKISRESELIKAFLPEEVIPVFLWINSKWVVGNLPVLYLRRRRNRWLAIDSAFPGKISFKENVSGGDLTISYTVIYEIQDSAPNLSPKDFYNCSLKAKEQFREFVSLICKNSSSENYTYKMVLDSLNQTFFAVPFEWCNARLLINSISISWSN